MENQIIQMIPLADRPAQYGNYVIALALIQQSDGNKRIVYIEHDRVSGCPVLQGEGSTQSKS